MPAQDLIDAYLAHLREESASENTIKDRRRTLTVLDRELPYGLDVANEEELRAWLWRDGLSMGSRETYYSCIRDFFVWAHAEAEVLDMNPTDGIKRPKVPARLPKPLTDEELEFILQAAAEPYRTWMILAAYAGMRCIEISRAQREDFTARKTRIPEGKGGKVRIIGTHPLVWKAIEPLPLGPITECDDDQVSTRSIHYFQQTLRMKKVGLHRGRHWFGTNLQRLYKDLRVTQVAMGHASPATTAGYALVVAEDVTEAISLLPSLDAEDDEGQTENPPAAQ